MSKIFVFFSLLLFANTIQLHADQGLRYSRLEIKNNFYFSFIKCRQTVHILEVDPALYEIRPTKALDNGVGLESVLSISIRHGAIASINGGFFLKGELVDGITRGALKIHDWYSIPDRPRGCIGWSSASQKPKTDRLIGEITFDSEIGNFSVTGLNCQRKVGDSILFTPCFHRTTLTNPDGEELVIVDGVVRSVLRAGSTRIPETGCVLSIQEQNPLFGMLREGMAINFTTKIHPLMDEKSSIDWESSDYIVGGAPLLLHNGAKALDLKSEKIPFTFSYNKRGRMAVGCLANGNWLFVTVDKKNLFDGMTINEFAELMQNLGCVEAINLDGGGSCTMVYKGSVKNCIRAHISKRLNKKVRKVSDAIVIIPKRQSPHNQ